MNSLLIFNLYKYQLASALASQLRIIIILLLSGKEGLGCFSLLIATTSLFALPSLVIQNNAFQSRILQDKSIRIDLFVLNLVLISAFLITISLGLIAYIHYNIVLRSLFSTNNSMVIDAVILSVPFYILQVIAEVSFTLKNNIKCYQQTFILTNALFVIFYLFIRRFASFDSSHSVAFAFTFSYIFSSVISIIRANLQHFHWQLNTIYSPRSIQVQQTKALFRILRDTFSLNSITVLSVISDWILKAMLDTIIGLSAVGTLQIFQSLDSLLGSIFAAPSYKKVLFAFSTRSSAMNHILRKEIYVLITPIVTLSVLLIAIRLLFPSVLAPNISQHFVIIFPLALYLLSRIPSFLLGFVGQILIAFNKLYAVILLECTSRISFTLIMLLFISFSSFSLYSIPISALVSSLVTLVLLYILSKLKHIPPMGGFLNFSGALNL